MTQVSLAQIPQALGPVFMAGDPAAEGKAQERSSLPSGATEGSPAFAPWPTT